MLKYTQYTNEYGSEDFVFSQIGFCYCASAKTFKNLVNVAV